MKLADTFQLVGNKIFAIVDQIFSNKTQRVENAYNKEKEFIENSVLNEEQKAQMIEGIEKKRAKKLAEIKRKEAIANKVKAIFDATIATAVAVAQTIANPILATIVGIAGAAQIAAISAAPLPALAQGGLAYGSTMAIVGDNPNAKVDPEVISPLSKLKKIMGSNNNNINLNGRFLLKGEDAELMVRDAQVTKERLYGAA